MKGVFGCVYKRKYRPSSNKIWGFQCDLGNGLGFNLIFAESFFLFVHENLIIIVYFSVKRNILIDKFFYHAVSVINGMEVDRKLSPIKCLLGCDDENTKIRLWNY